MLNKLKDISSKFKKFIKLSNGHRSSSTVTIIAPPPPFVAAARVSTGSTEEVVERSQSSIYVGGLPDGTDLSTLWNHFNQYGGIRQNEGVHVEYRPNNRSFAFIHFLDENSADKAVLGSHNLRLSGYKIMVEKRLQERATKNLVYTDANRIFRELVLCVNSEGDDVYVNIHGCRPCNIIHSKYMVSLSNPREMNDPRLEMSIEEWVNSQVNQLTQEEINLWTPPQHHRVGVNQHLVKQTIRHNLYDGNIHLPNIIQEATAAAMPFTDNSSPQNLVRFIKHFKAEVSSRARDVKLNLPSRPEDFMYRCSISAEKYYGMPVRVTVKSRDTVEFGILLDEKNQTVGHVYAKAMGNPTEFLQFLTKIQF